VKKCQNWQITLSFILKGLSFFVNLNVGFACFLTFAGLLQAYKHTTEVTNNSQTKKHTKTSDSNA